MRLLRFRVYLQLLWLILYSTLSDAFLLRDSWKPTISVSDSRQWQSKEAAHLPPLHILPSNLPLWATRGANKSSSRSNNSFSKKKTGHKKLFVPSKSQNEPKRPSSSSNSNPNNEVSSSSRQKSSSAPPWQVMSSKLAKTNIEKEIERRRLIKQGLKPSHEETHGDKSGPVSTVLSRAFLSDAEQRLLKWRPFQPASMSLQMRMVGAYLDKKLPPRLGVPEVAFLGRSNVGKSSLLNRLSKAAGTMPTEHARVGKTPGATASVNLYALHDAKHQRDVLAWADLPGFGYAKLSKQIQESVQVAAEHYLGKRQELMLGVLLVDIRRIPSDDDRAVLAALYDMGVPLVVVATKLDKISSSTERQQCLAEIRNGLGLPQNQPLAVSSVTGEGCRDLLKIILEACETGVKELGSKYDDSAATLPLQIDQGDDLEEGKDMDIPEPFSDDDDDVDDDDEDVVYSQGYDWIHGSEDGGLLFQGADYDDEINHNHDVAPSGDESHQPKRETLRHLKKKARIMQRRGSL